jgi:hypothetical protein
MNETIPLTLDSLVAQAPDLLASGMDGETVLLSLEQGRYYGLEEVGSRIWELLAAPRRVGDVCATLCREYEVDAATCAADVLDFLRALAAEKMIVFPDAPAA